MISANTQSVLMQIQPTIQRFARMLASVLQLDVEIVDENLCRVAGTGSYGKFLGQKLNTNSRLLRYIPVTIHYAKDAPVKIIVRKRLFSVRRLFFRITVSG